MSSYSPQWYANFRSSSTASAEQIVPLLLELVPAHSVVDVGCGLGVWLDAFRRHGVQRVWGLDGAHVEPNQMLIDAAAFRAHDLQTALPLDRTFDLAVSLEVAEHLPSACADRFVADLTQLAPVVFFSAAIPAQGGTHHVNERWPDYWADKFHRHGFQRIDAIRPQIWENDRVDFWYAQNAMIFASPVGLDGYPKLRDERQRTGEIPLSMVHPRLFARTSAQLERTIDFRLRRLVRRSLSWIGVV